MTAAHCCLDDNLPTVVRFGTVDLDDGDYFEDRNISVTNCHFEIHNLNT